MEKTKKDTYWDIDSTEYTYWPFILETCGAFGKPALQLCSKLRKMWVSKCCNGNDSHNQSELLLQPAYRHENTDPLLVSLSTLLQTHNAQMILELAPQNSALLDSEITRSQARSKSQKAWALERLKYLEDDAPTTIRRLTSITRSRQSTAKSETNNINSTSHPTAGETNDVNHRWLIGHIGCTACSLHGSPRKPEHFFSSEPS